MKPKLVVTCLSMLACSAWIATGCSSSSDSGTVSDAGPSTETGPSEGGGNPEGGTDSAVADAEPDGAITGAFVQIKYGVANCPAFTKCDSDPTGLWKVSGGCVTEDIFAQAKQSCAGIVESDVKFEARGNVIATATKIARNTEVKFSAKFFVPKVCVDQVGSCSTVAQALQFAGIMTATCASSATAGACDCAVSDQINDNLAAEGYTKSGGTITTATTMKTYDYCVAGTTVTYKETTASNPVPAILVLSK